MSEPLTPEERWHLYAHPVAHQEDFKRYEATVRAVEAERDALRAEGDRFRMALEALAFDPPGGCEGYSIIARQALDA